MDAHATPYIRLGLESVPLGRIGAMKRRAQLSISLALVGAALFSACDGGGAETDAGAGSAADSSMEHVGADAAATQTSQAPDARERLRPPTETCTVPAQCASGFCVDGVCCDGACDGSCESCALTGKVGACSPVKNALDDSCGGDSICDGSGACRRSLGKVCALPGDCASDNCVDGVCCATAACGTCQACAVPGSEGTCAPVPKFTDDADCSGEQTCDGLGACRSKNGTACGKASQCTSLQCSDGVCCAEACTGTCHGCNQPGSVGVCLPIVCTGARICATPAAGLPACRLKDGEPCTTSADCLNGSCLTSYRDLDGDRYGYDKVSRCELAPAPGYVSMGGDCCESDAATHPGVTTYSWVANACGGYDRNCDGRVERVDGGPETCGCIGPGAGGKLGTVQICTACR